MKITQMRGIRQQPVEMPGAQGARMRLLIGPDDGADTFHMRQFEVAPGGCTPHHEHDFEHEILILRGQGMAATPEGDRSFKTGDVIFVPAGEKHQFRNTGDTPGEFLCLIPAPEDCSV